MNWTYALGPTEYVFVLIFILAYAAFLFRTVRIARKLKTPARALALKFFVRVLYFGLLMIALLGPSLNEGERGTGVLSKDVYFLMDLSLSMDATDVVPSRLEKAKFEISKMVGTIPAARFGLIVFGNRAFMHAPLTSDLEAFRLFVKSVQTSLVPENGSDYCSALRMAYDRISADTTLNNHAKLLVLLTDGESENSCESALVRSIHRLGIELFVVGVGTQAGSSIQVNGKPLYDEENKIVISKLNERKMKSLADQAGGMYFSINNQNNDTDELTAAINQVHGLSIDSRMISVVNNKYYYFLGVALVLLLLDILVTIHTFRL